ncbi:hypothetical protein MU516_16225 [Paracoccus sp. YLB-12]|uniref:Uncharacterized protein n=1 Tax=Paracoccus maritimus TaxID=2933292 RepID=A0ABT2KDS0_9RHOB|nr:hypothetical protein [Paracoccus sp. YLB-12]MCT4334408.1 hypothetical protein [Paracoccus sp. YLB-12]
MKNIFIMKMISVLLFPSIAMAQDSNSASAIGACTSPNIGDREGVLLKSGWLPSEDPSLVKRVLSQFLLYEMSREELEAEVVDISRYEDYADRYLKAFSFRAFVFEEVEEVLIFGQRTREGSSADKVSNVMCVIASLDNVVNSTDYDGFVRNLPVKEEEDFGSHVIAGGFWWIVDKDGFWSQAYFSEFTVSDVVSLASDGPAYRALVHVSTEFRE